LLAGDGFVSPKINHLSRNPEGGFVCSYTLLFTDGLDIPEDIALLFVIKGVDLY